ncbi:MAG: alpha/beta fold hydrolase [Acidobacteria bacterium]|nr:alpha/beta fold hydrolase [Acidobacteriota bacterium]
MSPRPISRRARPGGADRRLPPFEPLFPNPLVATVAANFWPRRLDTRTYPVEPRRFRTAPGVEVLVHVQQPTGTAKGEAVLVHGLEGSSSSKYMLSLAQTLLTAGLAVHRMNIRTCGGTESWCPTLYHAGLTTDIRTYLESLSGPAWLIGFSLGANQALKLAGELGAAGPGLLRGVCGVSAPMDLAACSRATAEPRNRILQWHYLTAMKSRLKRRQAVVGERWIPSARLAAIRTLFDMDDQVTAPSFGFTGATHYYGTQSSAEFMAAIRVPALLVQAQDDPIIPFSLYSAAGIRDNPHVRLIAPAHGGHIGFLSGSGPRIWVDEIVRDWMRG